MWILVIHDDSQYGALCGDMLQHALGGDYILAANLRDASWALTKPGAGKCHLIVARSNVPPDANAPAAVDRSEPATVHFFRDLAQAMSLPPCIFIAAHTDVAGEHALRDLHRAALLGEKEVEASLVATAHRLLDERPDARKTQGHFLDVDITLNGTGAGCSWQLYGKNGIGKEDAGALRISPDDMETLLFQSELVGATKDNAQRLTKELIRRLGRDIYRCIMDDKSNNDGLSDELYHRTDGWGSLESTRFRFEVDDKTSHLLVEAMAQPQRGRRNREEYWMLRTPIFRRLAYGGGRLPLYKDRDSRECKVRCLVIQGTVDEFDTAPPHGKHFSAISDVIDEVAWLEGHLGGTENMDTFGLACVEILRPSDYRPGKFGPALREILIKGQWQLIHYAGHVDMSDGMNGYLVLGPHPADAISIDEFARAARAAQFVFLNSSLSAHPNFIMKLAQRNIPAAIGYAWPVRGEMALEFSREFYSQLFRKTEGGSAPRGFIEYAFMRAKAHLYAAHPQETQWSAPLLFMQTLGGQQPGNGATQHGPGFGTVLTPPPAMRPAVPM